MAVSSEESIQFPTRLRIFAERIGAEEFGFYFIIDGERIVIPLSLTADDLPGPATAPPPKPADRQPGSPTDPGA